MQDSVSEKFDARLRSHLGEVEWAKFSRIPLQRLQNTAVPHIGLIELVAGEDYDRLYAGLYESMFHSTERERSALIVQRLKDELGNKRHHLAPFRVIGLRSHDGQAIAAAQFSVLIPPGSYRVAVPYLQYIYVRPENRRQDLSELLHALILAVADADAAKHGRTVPFTFFETEPPSHGEDEASKAYATQRTQIHSKSGSLALMLRRESDGKVISAHVQPGLELEDPPLTLVWVVRPSPAAETLKDVDAIGDILVAAYYQSMRDEEFPEANIALAEQMVRRRRSGYHYCLLPLAEITHEMYNAID